MARVRYKKVKEKETESERNNNKIGKKKENQECLNDFV